MAAAREQRLVRPLPPIPTKRAQPRGIAERKTAKTKAHTFVFEKQLKSEKEIKRVSESAETPLFLFQSHTSITDLD